MTVSGYNVHDIASMSTTPHEPADESRNWYQWYVHSERGRRGLELHRSAFARQLWKEWSPQWHGWDDAFERTRPSFDNPDFVDTVVHSYRHRYGLAPGDPAHDASEARIAGQPSIHVPTIVLDPTGDPLDAPQTESMHRARFPQLRAHRLVHTGHNAPSEDPVSFADAVRDLNAEVRRQR